MCSWTKEFRKLNCYYFKIFYIIAVNVNYCTEMIDFLPISAEINDLNTEFLDRIV